MININVNKLLALKFLSKEEIPKDAHYVEHTFETSEEMTHGMMRIVNQYNQYVGKVILKFFVKLDDGTSCHVGTYSRVEQ